MHHDRGESDHAVSIQPDVDLHLSSRLPRRANIVSLGADATYVRRFVVRALDLNEAEVVRAHDAARKLYWNSPIALPLPRWKLQGLAGPDSTQAT